jgi:hypothetical protein
VAVAGVALLLASAIAAVGVYLRVRVEAATAADAAALAAAPVTFMPFGARGTPTEEAARFASVNGADLVSCDCPLDPSWETRTVTVVVAIPVTIWPVGRSVVTAESRAEFVPTALLGGG